MKLLSIIVLFLLSFSITFGQTKHISTESEKIKFLLNELDKPGSNLKFIRNGDEFTGKEAKEHMEKKLKYAGDKIKTVDDFINHIATKSYITGNLYYVKLPDGTKIESAKWLRDALKKLN